MWIIFALIISALVLAGSTIFGFHESVHACNPTFATIGQCFGTEGR